MICHCGERISGANKMKIKGVWLHKFCKKYEDKSKKQKMKDKQRLTQMEKLQTMVKTNKPLSRFWQTMKEAFGVK